MTRSESGRGDLGVSRERDVDQSSITKAADERVHQVTDKAAEAFDAMTTGRARPMARRALAGTVAAVMAVLAARIWRRHQARKNVGPLQNALDQARSRLRTTGGQVGRQAHAQAAKAKARAAKAKARSRR